MKKSIDLKEELDLHHPGKGKTRIGAKASLSMQIAYIENGGDDGFIAWCRCNPDAFYERWMALAPKEMHVEMAKDIKNMTDEELLEIANRLKEELGEE